MTRELKLALIVGFSLVLVVTVLISDHLSKARNTALAGIPSAQPGLTTPVTVEPMVAPPPSEPTAPDRKLAAGNLGNSAPLMGLRAEQKSPVFEPTDEQPVTPVAGANVPAVSDEKDLAGPVIVNQTASAQKAMATPNVPAEPSVGAEVMHTVADGDSLYKIAKSYYGDGSQWKKISAANADKVKGESLKVGSKLRIPNAKLAIAEPPTASNRDTNKAGSKKPQTYKVKKGDTLNEISRRELGSAGRMHELMRLNDLDDEDTVQIGMVLKLPQS